MDLLYSFQVACNIILICGVLLSFVKDDYWIFRILEYPRFQKFIGCLIILSLWPISYSNERLDIFLIILLAAATIYLFVKIFPYTILSQKEMKTVSGGRSQDQIKLLTANVMQDNEKYEILLDQIKRNDPDIIFLLETDSKWEKAMEPLCSEYPYHIGEPLNNTYGLLLYSRLTLEKAEVKHIVEDDVPSVEINAVLPSGQKVRIWGLHPKPPVPKESERTTAKDKELMKVAFMARECPFPVIVMGDLNDVAWSYTTELFRKTSRLLDPRRGRGFFSTFNAKSLVMRFPLDYVFCSNDIGLIRMQRLPKNGSDHFAMFIHLQYDPKLASIQRAPKADREEERKAEEKA
jgi:endonuclease/exonuclease/phosphatase (EEP) superfamily protein YafD